MMQRKLYITDERILQLAEIMKMRGQIKFEKEMFDAVHIPKQTVTNVRIGNQHFTVTHLIKICKKFNVDGNWILGIHNEDPFVKRGVFAVNKIVNKIPEKTQKRSIVKK